MNLLDVRKTSTRTRVLETAKVLFAQKGYSACSMRELATRARVNEVTVFRLFGTKQKLYAEVLSKAAESSRVIDLATRENPKEKSLQNRQLREVAHRLGDSLFTRLFLFGILEQPEVTMRQLDVPLQSLSSQLSERFRGAGLGGLPLRDAEAVANMMEALALYHQCSSKLLNGKHGRKRFSRNAITQPARDVWSSTTTNNRKSGTDN
jgi:AcrR family transcriptional regulator